MRALWLPIFSMRSYETGKYAILKDGNFQLALSRSLASDLDAITLGVPYASSDLLEAQERVHALSDRITLRPFHYGENAVDTRKRFWSLNALEHLDSYDVLISDITAYPGELPVIYNFNITKLPELDRPYIDQFWEQDLESMRRSLFTMVINPCQQSFAFHTDPSLIGKVFFNTRCANSRLLPRSRVVPAPANTIFWPFRLSDKAYQFEKFLSAFEAQGLQAEYHIVVTDPNESLAIDRPYIEKITPTKDEYYRILESCPIVIMLDDMDTVLHPGTIEFMYYGCPLIAYENMMIENPNGIQTLNDLRWRLEHLERAPKIDLSPFVYWETDVDAFINKTFIQTNHAF